MNNSVTLDFKRGFRNASKTRNTAKSRKYLKKTAHRRMRRQGKNLVKTGRQGKYKPVTRWDVD